jgi:hypothetical protein
MGDKGRGRALWTRTAPTLYVRDDAIVIFVVIFVKEPSLWLTDEFVIGGQPSRPGLAL